MLNILHVLIFHLNSLFGEMSIHVFWIIDLRSFFFSDVQIQCCKFSFLLLQLCTTCSYMLYFRSVLCVFKFPLQVSSLIHGVFSSVLLSFYIRIWRFGDFPVFTVTDFQLDSFMIRELTLIFILLVDICFMIQDMVYLDNCCMSA